MIQKKPFRPNGPAAEIKNEGDPERAARHAGY
jgi:hypothetical protein